MEAIFWWIAAGATGILAVQLLLNLLGIDFDHDFDLDLPLIGNDVSISSILAFLSVGGWAGTLSFQIPGITLAGSMLTALCAGTAGFVGSLFLLQRLRSLEESGNLLNENAVGKIAEVYLGIPAKRKGEGQIQLLLQGRLVILDAFTDGDEIATGEKVLIYSVEEGKMIVEKCDPQLLADHTEN